ncbi:hypothetical protein Q8A67_017274 [Cirrhinus molitorella]|uniref:Uncharacterized protein n=1 Tax=Cirrhinus molitorella TaxID=172907 RepID=A0AA88PHZ5_9TELE|nr:hypothetical protein Q8A67_017274 [Cirrhinus molitorella]
MAEVDDERSLVQPHQTDVAQTDPEHSPLTSVIMETTMPEPPADGELPPAASMGPVTTVPTSAMEPKFPFIALYTLIFPPPQTFASSPAQSQLSSCSPSSSPVSRYVKVNPLDSHSTASPKWVDHLALPPASDSLVAPRPIDLSAPP